MEQVSGVVGQRTPGSCSHTRWLDLPASVREHVRIKERERGYDEATMVESFAVLNAVGGECCDDFERLREDPGLCELIGHEVPSPASARQPRAPGWRQAWFGV